MDRRIALRAAAALVLASVLVLGGTLASAGPGDTPDEAISLQPPTSTVGTTTSGHEWVIYSIAATYGRTIAIEASSGVSACQMLIGEPSSNSYLVRSTAVSTSTAKLTFTPPRTGTFTLAFTADELGPFSLLATPTAAVPFSVGSMWAPTSARSRRTISVAARTFPGYNGLRAPVKFMIERWTGKRWKVYGSTSSKFTSQILGGSSSKVTGSFKISAKGTYRIRASITDAAHPSPRYSVWRKFKVK